MSANKGIRVDRCKSTGIGNVNHPRVVNSIVIGIVAVVYGVGVPEIWRVVVATVCVTGGALLLGEVVLLQLILATGGVSLAGLTEGERTLLADVGGINLEGFRLLSIIGAGATLCVFRRSVRSALMMRKPYVAFLCLAALSLLWTPSRFDGLRLLCMLCYPFIGYGLAVVTCRTQGDHHVRVGIIAGAVIASAVGVLGAATSGEWAAADSWDRYRGSLGASPFGLFCSVTALPVYGWARMSGSKSLQLVFLLLAAQTVASGTRIAVLALLAGLIALEALRGGRWRPIGIAGLGVALWLVVPALGARSGMAMAPGLGPVGASVESMNWSGRWVIWQSVWSEMVSGGGFWGHGLGSSAAFLAGKFPTAEVVHNEYVRILAELGPLGLGMFVFAYGDVLFRLGTMYRLQRSGRPAALVAAAAVVAFLVTSATDNTLGYYSIYSVFTWVLVGVALAPEAVKPRVSTK